MSSAKKDEVGYRTHSVVTEIRIDYQMVKLLEVKRKLKFGKLTFWYVDGGAYSEEEVHASNIVTKRYRIWMNREWYNHDHHAILEEDVKQALRQWKAMAYNYSETPEELEEPDPFTAI